MLSHTAQPLVLSFLGIPRAFGVKAEGFSYCAQLFDQLHRQYVAFDLQQQPRRSDWPKRYSIILTFCVIPGFKIEMTRSSAGEELWDDVSPVLLRYRSAVSLPSSTVEWRRSQRDGQRSSLGAHSKFQSLELMSGL
jgi:hypothetical protein